MLSGLHRAPFAVACWLGLAGRPARGPRILCGHGTPRGDAAGLERQLRYLRRDFRVVPLSELVARPDGEPERVALTFDDGLRSNVTVAAPLLRRLGLPATFFVCPGLIDAGGWLWTHEARWRLAALGRDVEPAVERMKAMSPAARRHAEDTLRRATPGLRPTPGERETWDLATWDELRRLDPALFTIGSHSLSHPILTSADATALEAEVGGSRRLLEGRLQRPVEYFCYPNGDADSGVLACVRRHYRAAVSDSGRDVHGGCDPHLLPRLNLPRGALRLASRMNRARA